MQRGGVREHRAGGYGARGDDAAVSLPGPAAQYVPPSGGNQVDGVDVTQSCL